MSVYSDVRICKMLSSYKKTIKQYLQTSVNTHSYTCCQTLFIYNFVGEEAVNEN